MASTAIWSETISFRLVSAPVRPHTAIDEKDLHFHLPHTNDDSIGYEKVQSGGKARSGRRDRHGVRVRARKGREVHVEPATEEQAAPSDVLAALRESVAQHVK